MTFLWSFLCLELTRVVSVTREGDGHRRSGGSKRSWFEEVILSQLKGKRIII